MSRGPGHWQQLLLSLVHEYDFVPVVDVVENAAYDQGRQAKRADHVAARRAARRLAESGQLRAIYMARCTGCAGLFNGWGARCCARVTHSLVVTRDRDTRSLLPRSIPSWISLDERQLRNLRPKVASCRTGQKQHLPDEVSA